MRPPGGKIRSQIRSSGSNCAARASVSPSGRDHDTGRRRRRARPGRPPCCRARRPRRWRCARSATIASRALPLPRWYGEAEELTTRRAPAATSSRFGRAGVPDVLADRQADQRAVDLDQRRLRARLEVAALVEDPVVGQIALAVDRPHLAAGENGERVVGRGRGRVDQGVEVARARRRAAPRAPGSRPGRRSPSTSAATASSASRDRVQEVPAQHEVLGRVAGEAELGEQHELRAARPGRCRSTPRSGATLPSMSPTVGSIWASASRRCVASAMDPSMAASTRRTTHPRLGLPCRACSGRSGTLAGAEEWS